MADGNRTPYELVDFMINERKFSIIECKNFI